jgi:two-component system phosphate regulon response regulator PhoB/two-component system alkaline phosphatase synthesis response regulator PhoP
MAKLDGKKVLLVEDDMLMAQMLGQKLAEEKATLDHAADGEQAMDFLKKNKYDVVVLDLLLPKLDGFGVLENMGKDDAMKKIPVIVLSNLGQKKDVDRGLALGAKKFLVKAILSLDDVADAAAEVMK